MPIRAPFDPRSVIVVGLAASLVVARCAGAPTTPSAEPSPATASSTPAGVASPTAAPSLAADAIQHPTGASDIVLRAATRGGFLRMEVVMSRVPEFTLYGDGRVLVLPPGDDAAGGSGGGINPGGVGFGATVEVPVLRETHLSEDEVQTLLRYALVDGHLGTARDAYMGGNMDAPSTVFELHADGSDRSILVTGLTDDPAPGPDAVALKAFSSLVTKLRSIGAGDDYHGDRVEAVIAEFGPNPGMKLEAWPWSDLTPADFPQPPDDATIAFPSRLLTAAQATAASSLTGGKPGLTSVRGPDGRAYELVLRPALPEEISPGS